MSSESARLLPGRTAYAYGEISLRLTIFMVVPMFAALGSAVLAFAGRVDKSVLVTLLGFWGAYVFGSLFAVGIPFYRKNNREIRSGYTTLFNAYQQLEQRDPETGDVIRAASDPYPQVRSLKALRKWQGAIVAPPRVWTKRNAAFAATLGVAVTGAAFVLLQSSRLVAQASDGSKTAVLPGYSLLGVTVLSVVVWLTVRGVWISRRKSTLAALGAQFPNALICDAFPTLSFVPGPKMETTDKLIARSKSTTLALVASDTGVTFVERIESEPVTVGWNEVAECTVGWVEAGMRSLPALVIRVSSSSIQGGRATLVLRTPRGGGMFPASRHYVAEIARRLEGLRLKPGTDSR
ncbi:hypothetical protein [Cryobacterium sp. GrIS_2_6]|uniref:hypothetical protein n=1 Tax=Cryobacterium sp. GrIS_2_6 TaxID=3162785 RepID=UPI002DFE9155|nr:hypothetical protein [Cryobacterium psychrotolerans]